MKSQFAIRALLPKDGQVNRAGNSSRQAAREWVCRNQSIVDGWLGQP